MSSIMQLACSSAPSRPSLRYPRAGAEHKFPPLLIVLADKKKETLDNRAADVLAGIRALRGIASPPLPGQSWTPTVAWLAGLLEGEGTFTAKAGRGSWVTISVEMCDRATVARAAAMLGASAIWRDANDIDRGWKPTYITKVSGNQARPWMATVRSLMGHRRRAAIDRALASWTPMRLWPVPIVCHIADCGRPHRARGLCHAHYMRWSRYRATGRDPGFQPLS